ncbi:MAG: hypothetical protein KAH32_05185 [Chlamydiia bacterium]|nr:hypothetical protein [Chlamydiia bacterium]
MTLKEMASAIRNHIVDGLKGVTNEAFSTEQLTQEILLETNLMIEQGLANKLITLQSLYQRIDGIDMSCTDTSANCDIPSLTSYPMLLIPKLLITRDPNDSISYFGSMDNSLRIKLYFNEDYKYHKYNLATAHRPFGYVNINATKNGMHELYLINLGKYESLKYLSISALFESPYKLLETKYRDQFEGSEFFAPRHIQAQVIASITQKYVNYYRQLNMPVQPNTQEKQ